MITLETGIIYGWYCTVNDKWYIGQTVYPESRKRAHEYNGTHTTIYDSYPLYIDMKKYGIDKFEYHIIHNGLPSAMLNEMERFYIRKYNAIEHGYNARPGGGAPRPKIY